MDWFVYPFDHQLEHLQERQQRLIFQFDSHIIDHDLCIPVKKLPIQEMEKMYNELFNSQNRSRTSAFISQKKRLDTFMDVQKGYILLHRHLLHLLPCMDDLHKAQIMAMLSNIKKNSHQLMKDIDRNRRTWRDDYPLHVNANVQIGVNYPETSLIYRYKENFCLSYLTEMYIKLKEKNIVVLYGDDGVGKTTLTKYYAYEANKDIHANDFQFLVDARSIRSIKKSYVEAVKMFDRYYVPHDKTLKQVQADLSSYTEQFYRTFVIFDHAPSYSFLKDLNLLDDFKQCIITTEEKPTENVEHIQVSNFCSEDALCLVKQYLKEEQPDNLLQELCYKLNYSPKAIVEACTFLNHLSCSDPIFLNDYITNLYNTLSKSDLSPYSLTEKLIYMHLSFLLPSLNDTTRNFFWTICFLEPMISIKILRQYFNSWEQCCMAEKELEQQGIIKSFLRESPIQAFIKIEEDYQKMGRVMLNLQSTCKEGFFNKAQQTLLNFLTKSDDGSMYSLLQDIQSSPGSKARFYKSGILMDDLNLIERSWKNLCQYAKNQDVLLVDEDANFVRLKKREMKDIFYKDSSQKRIYIKSILDISEEAFSALENIYSSKDPQNDLTVYSHLLILFQKYSTAFSLLARTDFSKDKSSDIIDALHLLKDLAQNPNLEKIITCARTLNAASFFLKLWAAQYDSPLDVLSFLQKSDQAYSGYYTLKNTPYMTLYIGLSTDKKAFLKTVKDFDLQNLTTFSKMNNLSVRMLHDYHQKCLSITGEILHLSALLNTFAFSCLSNGSDLFNKIHTFAKQLKKNKLVAYDFLSKRINNLDFFIEQCQGIEDGETFARIEPSIKAISVLPPVSCQTIQTFCNQLLDFDDVDIPSFHLFGIYDHFLESCMRLLYNKNPELQRLKNFMYSLNSPYPHLEEGETVHDALTKIMIDETVRYFIRDDVDLFKEVFKKVSFDHYLDMHKVITTVFNKCGLSFVISVCKQYIEKDLQENNFDATNIERYLSTLTKVYTSNPKDIFAILEFFDLKDGKNIDTVLIMDHIANCYVKLKEEGVTPDAMLTHPLFLKKKQLLSLMAEHDVPIDTCIEALFFNIPDEKLDLIKNIPGIYHHLPLVYKAPIERLIELRQYAPIFLSTKMPLEMILEKAIHAKDEQWTDYLKNPFNPDVF